MTISLRSRVQAGIRLLSLFVLLAASQVTWALPSAKVTVQVVDETGVPVADAKVSANFTIGDDSNIDRDVTDGEGYATLSGDSDRYVSFGAEKQGYYRTRYEYRFDTISGITGFRRWNPWNETFRIVLKQRKNPRPLIIGLLDSTTGGTSLNLPVTGKPVGYDLVAGDWVVPYGLGTTRDMIFNMTGNRVSDIEFDRTLRVSFSNPGDGIIEHSAPLRQGSDLRMPHEAPLQGYQASLTQRYARTPERILSAEFPEERNYFFRIRTKLDDDGNVVSALYGKIHGNIRFHASGEVSFIYYLNPDSNERGLEFDQQTNLMTIGGDSFWYGNLSP